MLKELCARCNRPLPTDKMVLGVPGVGTFHSYCKPTRRQLIWHWLYRCFGPRPRGTAAPAGSTGFDFSGQNYSIPDGRVRLP
jgi:hypothetical protein